MPSMLQNRGVLAVATVVVCAVALGLILSSRDQPASADDATHTTSLSITTYPFDGPAEAAVVATLLSTDSNDVAGKIVLLRKPPGSGSTFSVVSMADSPTDPSDSGVDMDAALSMTSVSSGDTVRADFYTYDGNGGQTFSYSRQLPIP